MDVGLSHPASGLVLRCNDAERALLEQVSKTWSLTHERTGGHGRLRVRSVASNDPAGSPFHKENETASYAFKTRGFLRTGAPEFGMMKGVKMEQDVDGSYVIDLNRYYLKPPKSSTRRAEERVIPTSPMVSGLDHTNVPHLRRPSPSGPIKVVREPELVEVTLRAPPEVAAWLAGSPWAET